MIGNTVRVMEIATGQREEEFEAEEPKDKAAAELGRKGEGRLHLLKNYLLLRDYRISQEAARSVVSAKAGFLWL